MTLKVFNVCCNFMLTDEKAPNLDQQQVDNPYWLYGSLKWNL